MKYAQNVQFRHRRVLAHAVADYWAANVLKTTQLVILAAYTHVDPKLVFFLKKAAKDLSLQCIRREIDKSLHKIEQKEKQKKNKKQKKPPTHLS